jgi:hypothetical protein
MSPLPKPLTEDGLRSLMRDPRYRNPGHPQHEVVREAVAEGYQRLYPGPVELDATGRRPCARSSGQPQPREMTRKE